jgi:hypothetical protein
MRRMGTFTAALAAVVNAVRRRVLAERSGRRYRLSPLRHTAAAGRAATASLTVVVNSFVITAVVLQPGTLLMLRLCRKCRGIAAVAEFGVISPITPVAKVA